MELLSLKRMSAFQLLKLAGKLYVRNLSLWFSLALLPQLVVLLMLLGLDLQGDKISGVTLGFYLLVTVLSDGASLMMLTLAAGYAVLENTSDDGKNKRSLGIKCLLKLAVGVPWVGVLLTYAAASFISVLGFILLIIPGILLGTLLQLVVCTALWDNPLPHAAMARSVGLIRSDFFTSLGLFLVVFLIVKVQPFLLLLIQNSFFPGPLSPLLVVIFSSLANPFGAAVQTLLYLSLLKPDMLTNWQTKIRARV